MILLNCSGYRNGTNYSVSQALATGESLIVKNCLALGSAGSIGSFAIQATNSWLPPFVVTAGDFASLDTTGVRGPRGADGSLPDLPFMRLAAGSDLIDSGTDVGLPFNGLAPDLGCFETEGSSSVEEVAPIPPSFSLDQNYPNPFNGETNIGYRIRGTGHGEWVMLKVYDLLGRELATLVDKVQGPGSYSAQWNAAGVASGVYLYRLLAGPAVLTQKLMVLR